MSAPKLIALSAAAALGLAACNNPDNGRAAGGSRICTPFPDAANGQAGNPSAAQIAADPAAAMDDCLHRWAYSLAPSSDRAEEVAQASVAACASSLSRWNQQGLTTGAPGAPSSAPGSAELQNAPSLVTGQPTNPMAEHYSYAQNRALFYVVQARAGKCPAPAAPAASANGNTTR